MPQRSRPRPGCSISPAAGGGATKANAAQPLQRQCRSALVNPRELETAYRRGSGESRPERAASLIAGSAAGSTSDPRPAQVEEPAGIVDQCPKVRRIARIAVLDDFVSEDDFERQCHDISPSQFLQLMGDALGGRISQATLTALNGRIARYFNASGGGNPESAPGAHFERPDEAISRIAGTLRRIRVLRDASGGSKS